MPDDLQQIPLPGAIKSRAIRLVELARSPGLAFIPIALAVFLALDFGIAAIFKSRIDAAPMRLPYSSTALVDDVIDAARAAAANNARPVAIFLGDSVARADDEPADRSLPARFERDLRSATGKDWRVFDLSLTAANNSDKLLLTHRWFHGTETTPDLVVIEDNFKFYGSEYRLQTARYSRLADGALWRTLGPGHLHGTLELAIPKRDTLARRAEEEASALVGRLFLARNRDILANALGLGDHPARRGLLLWNRAKHALNRDTPIARKDADSAPSTLDVPIANLHPMTGVNMRALGELVEIWRKRRVPYLVYLTPINRDAATIDPAAMRYFWRNAFEAAGSAPSFFADLTLELPAEDFRDLDHLTDDGLARLSSALAGRAAKITGPEAP
ncbi:MAG: hypothetical protein H6685_13410 [Deltaproteobacteria bacterium]|nr:hypothetical protein [Deltaproteobacteria bacterium]